MYQIYALETSHLIPMFGRESIDSAVASHLICRVVAGGPRYEEGARGGEVVGAASGAAADDIPVHLRRLGAGRFSHPLVHWFFDPHD